MDVWTSQNVVKVYQLPGHYQMSTEVWEVQYSNIYLSSIRNNL